jgi:MFS family permease
MLGVGTAMVYPTLLAAIGDVAHPTWRASAVGVYRLWRDLGYALGALLAGLTADAFGLAPAMWLVAALTFVSGALSALRMTETLPSSNAIAKKDGQETDRPAIGGFQPATEPQRPEQAACNTLPVSDVRGSR